MHLYAQVLTPGGQETSWPPISRHPEILVPEEASTDAGDEYSLKDHFAFFTNSGSFREALEGFSVLKGLEGFWSYGTVAKVFVLEGLSRVRGLGGCAAIPHCYGD